MSDIQDIYQQVVLDHYKKPRNFKKLENATSYAHGHNALCGDKITVYLILKGGVVDDISFEGSGCAICTASSSIMTQAVKGKSVEEAEALFNGFHNMVMDEGDTSALDVEGMSRLKAFEGVKEFPVRVKCATLPWHTFHAALHRMEDEPVSTE